MTKRDLDPDDYDDFSDWMDDCTGEGVDEDTCQIIWDERSMTNGVKHKITSKAIGGNADGMQFILSDASVDRYEDIIEPAGWQLANFNANPIALFSHRSDFPIGKWENVGVRDGALRGTLKLAPEGTSDRLDELRRLVDAGILKAVSVGFMPIETNRIEGTSGYRYIKQELMECSLVSVPANPSALAVAKSLRISDDTMRLAFRKLSRVSRVAAPVIDRYRTTWNGEDVGPVWRGKKV
jgi:HK97 family phage prohead protease